ncbi:MAG: hypothetical protein LLG04_13785 [Parachlamydia sp.]|nr:hypothetical protein [Parachlamydia sp.]
MLLITQQPPHVNVEIPRALKSLPLSLIDVIDINREKMNVAIYSRCAAKYYKKEFLPHQKINFEAYAEEILHKLEMEPRKWRILTTDNSRQVAANLSHIQTIVQRMDPNDHKLMFKGISWFTFDKKNFNPAQIAEFYEILSNDLIGIDENKTGLLNIYQPNQNMTVCCRFCCAIEVDQRRRTIILRTHSFPDGHLILQFVPETPLDVFLSTVQQMMANSSIWKLSDKTDLQNPNSVLHYINTTLKTTEVFQNLVKPIAVKSSRAA